MCIRKCKCNSCSLQFTEDCVKSDVFLAKTFDQKKHESIENVMYKLQSVAFPNWPYKIETIDVISRFVPKKGYLGIVMINNIENNKSKTFEKTSQLAIDKVVKELIDTLDSCADDMMK